MRPVDRRRRQDLLCALANLPFVPAPRWRGRILRSAGVQSHPRVDIYTGVRVAGEDVLVLGEGSFVNHDCFFDTAGRIEVGRAVALGDHVRVITSAHEIGGPGRRAGRRHARPVMIEDGCWIGSSATILPGVAIGAGCVIGAGAVVTASCEPGGLYVGVPARRVRELADDAAA
jgi:acetyltransferase-like isoleucine patch superfamily enzyme